MFRMNGTIGYGEYKVRVAKDGRLILFVRTIHAKLFDKTILDDDNGKDDNNGKDNNSKDNGNDGEDDKNNNNNGGNGDSGGSGGGKIGGEVGGKVGGVVGGEVGGKVGCCSLLLVAWQLHTLGIVQICLGMHSLHVGWRNLCLCCCVIVFLR